MRFNFKSFGFDKKKIAVMLAMLIFVVWLNCLRGIKVAGYNYGRFKFVATDMGTIRGHLADDGDYFAFLGIPYAAPPVGQNRFKSPKPPQSWNGILDGNRIVKCPQRGEGVEDCLVINVFTPLQSQTSLPVLVYIHGGSFLIGAAPTKGMDPLIKENIIVVTLNYRLGALGFLCLGIESAPGNAGLKDQVAALEWVKNNIGSFGGNANEVTVYGMSAGGASVEYLTLSEMANGLFNKAIVESGSATSVWAIDASPVQTAINIAGLLGLPATNSPEVLAEYYQDIDLKVLNEVNYGYYSNLTDGTFGFVPCVETKLPEVEAFITEPPLKLLDSGTYNNVPIMFFFATLEGLFLRSAEYYDNKYKERMEGNVLDFLPADLIFEKDNFKAETVRNVKHLYFGNGTSFEAFDCLIYFGDCLILHGLLHSVEARSLMSSRVFLMEFSYKGGLGSNEEHYKTIDKAGHGDVVKYAILNRPPKDESDIITVRRISNLIANFVKHSHPTPSVTSLLPVAWPTVKPGNITYLHLDHEFEVLQNPYEARIAFWEDLYTRFREPVQAVHPN